MELLEFEIRLGCNILGEAISGSFYSVGKFELLDTLPWPLAVPYLVCVFSQP